MTHVPHEPLISTGYEPPGVPASPSALIFDDRRRLLILRPTYKPGWTIPGGVMENDGETPWQACQREVREECGLEVTGARLACVDFRPPRPGRPGGIRFLFDCGQQDAAALRAVTLQPEEIAEYALVPVARRPGAVAEADPAPGPGRRAARWTSAPSRHRLPRG